MQISVIELSISMIESWVYPYISQTWMNPLIIDIYPKVIMDIRSWIIDIYNWIMDISISNCIYVIMDIHDSIIDAHIWVMDYP